ncbi:hypothetical protein EPA93_37840 [Ktedonosporobacter rubrisoli]|uniref:Uncharacterized protein n=1 Tax=Ktedonosporobacter rubrisoli TaxID=2509675 RepID=A0A4P6K193_KTERU|nr:hypothetical protein [Ktedonosporobacter rubrisoli]QBD81430.1 hypothetical protein EPA93_37840 [Ktedonosporobacter rubrisoli]
MFYNGEEVEKSATPASTVQQQLMRIEVWPGRRWGWFGQKGWWIGLQLLHEQLCSYRKLGFVSNFSEACKIAGVDPKKNVWTYRNETTSALRAKYAHDRVPGVPFIMF